MSLKKILLILGALILLAWTAGEVLLYRDAHTVPSTATSTSATTTLKREETARVTAKPLATTSLPASERVKAESASTVTSAPQQSTKNTISVTLTVEGKSSTYRIGQGESVATLMRVASEEGALSYIASDYAGLGLFIKSINGKANNANKNDLYWIYSVNGKKANIGVSQFELREGDKVSWTYEKNIY